MSNKSPSALMDYLLAIESLENEYARQIGRIATEWNRLHFLFFRCFALLLKLDEKHARALWETAQGGDGKQRNMLRSIVGLVKRQRDRDALIGVLNDVDVLGSYRNSLIHTMVEIDAELIQLKVNNRSINIGHVNRVEEVIKHDKFHAIRKDLENLNHYMLIMLPRFSGGKQTILLKKPTLKAIPAPIPAKKKETRSGKKKPRSRQPQSSRP